MLQDHVTSSKLKHKYVQKNHSCVDHFLLSYLTHEHAKSDRAEEGATFANSVAVINSL